MPCVQIPTLNRVGPNHYATHQPEHTIPPRLNYALQKRQEQLPTTIRAVAWRAQLCLFHRYKDLRARGLQHNKICVAIARELVGFMWRIEQGQPLTMYGSAEIIEEQPHDVTSSIHEDYACSSCQK